MFGGSGFGVGLTVTELGGGCPPEAAGPAGMSQGAPPRLAEVLPVEARSAAEKAVELQRIEVLEGQLAAYKARLVCGFAADRPEAADPPAGQPGAAVNARSPIPGTSEFFVDELALVLNGSRRAADRLAADSWVLVQRLPDVEAALADGVLDRARARVFIDVLGATAAGVAEAVAPQVLPEAARLSPGRLRAALERAVLTVDAAAAERRREQAQRSADVRVYPVADGMAEFVAQLPAPVAAACWSAVDQLAQQLKDGGDGRPIGQLRGSVVADLLLRPWDVSRPAVTAQLTLFAPLPALARRARGPGQAGEVNGRPITVAHVREVLEQLDAVCPGGLQAPPGGSLRIAFTDDAGRLLATAGRAELARIGTRGCPAHPAGTDSVGGPGCGCPVLGPPAAVDGYRPSAAQRRFLATRDRTCRQPGCGQPVGRVDIDHVRSHASGGATDCDNLCCLCRSHHRLKTHARGWRFELTPDGWLSVTTPSGVTRITRPPGWPSLTVPPDLPLPSPPPAGLMPEARPAGSPSPDDDPPPF